METLSFDLLQFLYHLALAILVGGSLVLGTAVAPALFTSSRSRSDAGTLFGNILARFDYSPREIERSNPSMVEGGAVHGDITPDQMGAFRPVPGFNYRMPIDGLYLCGGSTHPMGGIIGACGRNAATVLADDLGVQRWWKLPTEEPGSVWAALAALK